MPIDRTDFEQETDALTGELQRPTAVVEFLLDNSDTAYTASEIADATNIPDIAIHGVLVGLRGRDILLHKGDYWAITDDTDWLDQVYY